jgi:hypothetical protein
VKDVLKWVKTLSKNVPSYWHTHTGMRMLQGG